MSLTLVVFPSKEVLVFALVLTVEIGVGYTILSLAYLSSLRLRLAAKEL